MAWGAVIGAAVSLYSSNQQKKAADKSSKELGNALDVQAQANRLGVSLEDVFGKRLEPPEFEFTIEDIFNLTDRLATFNANRGTDLANKSAGKINEQTLADLEKGMAQLFGGQGEYEQQRDLANQATTDQLEGRLSASARRALGRRAISTGAASLGEGAVDDLYAGYLGLTTEDIVQRGQNNYRSFFATYRQAFPLTTGAQVMPYTTLTPEAGVNLAFQTQVAQYEAGLNQAMAEAAPDPVASGLINAEMQRAAAMAGLNYQSGQAQASGYGAAGQQLAGAFQGYQATQGLNYGSNSGVTATGANYNRI